jgi:hypothetical protein
MGPVIDERNNALHAAHPGRGSCPSRGGSGVRTTRRASSEARNASADRVIAEAEPRPCSVPVLVRQTPAEAVGMPRSRVADKGARANESEAEAASASRATLGVHLHPRRRGCLEREHRQWLLRRTPDGPAVPVPVRSGLRRSLGHGRQLANLGAASDSGTCLQLRSGLLPLAQHGPRLRANITKGA